MSHFTRIKTQLTEVQYIKQALTEMGYEVIEPAKEGQTVTVGGYGSGTTQAALKIKTPNRQYDIGFVKDAKNGGYEIVADWWGIHSNINQQRFVQQLNQKYSYCMTIAMLTEQGFVLTQETNETDGSISMSLTRYA